MWTKIKNFFKENYKMLILATVISAAFMTIMTNYQEQQANKIPHISYNEYLALLEEDAVDTVYYNDGNEWMTITLFNEYTRQLPLEERLEYDGYKFYEKRMVLYPAHREFRQELLEQNVIVKLVASKSSKLEVFLTVITLALPIFWIIIIISMFSKQLKGARTQIEVITDCKTKFTDVIGHDEIIKDLKFITELIKDPSIGDSVGAKLPKGILLSGEPGCGKTLIAKAIAGEAGVSFIYQHSSSFINKFVGQGAENVRNLFKVAKQNAPCVIFIDEIDAVGEDRDNNKGTSENTQTINELLQAMSGFDDRDDIFIIAATNRPDVLDSALVRSGRFDRQIIVSKPRDWKVRKQLFEFYLQKFTCDENIDLDNISKQTAGFTGADVSSICNDASIIAVMNKKDKIDEDCLEEAIDQKILKGNRSDKEQHPEDKNIIAYHEAGHAVMNFILGEPIARASIQSTISGVGGAVWNEDKDSVFQSNVDFEHQMLTCFAGRVSEELKFNVITTGASNDISKATQIMYYYVEKLGFDDDFGIIDIGVLVNHHLINGDEILAKFGTMSKKYYAQCKEILKANYHLVELLATRLLEVDTLTGREINALFDNATVDRSMIDLTNTEE